MAKQSSGNATLTKELKQDDRLSSEELKAKFDRVTVIERYTKDSNGNIVKEIIGIQ